MGGFFSNLKAQFFPPKQANPVVTRQGGLVQTVISRSNTLTGVKQPISKTPSRIQSSPKSAAAMKGSDYWQGYDQR
jgi:hypothetical protein